MRAQALDGGGGTQDHVVPSRLWDPLGVKMPRCGISPPRPHHWTSLRALAAGVAQELALGSHIPWRPGQKVFVL